MCAECSSYIVHGPTCVPMRSDTLFESFCVHLANEHDPVSQSVVTQAVNLRGYEFESLLGQHSFLQASFVFHRGLIVDVGCIQLLGKYVV